MGVGAYLWLQQQHQKTEEASIVKALPEDTILFAHIPDGTASYGRYQLSNLKKVAECTELKFVKAWAMNLGEAKLNPSQKEDIDKTQDLFNQLGRSLDGESFIAILPVDVKNIKSPGLKEIPVVFGLRPKEGSTGAQALIGKIKQLLGSEADDAPKGKGQHGDISYEWVDCPRGVRICQGQVGDWSITTLSEPTLHKFIDRYQNKIQTPSLAEAASYKTLRGRLQPGEDAFVYFNFQTALEMAQLAIDDPEIPKGMISKALDQFRFLTATGIAVRFQKNELEDTIVALAPKANRPDLGRNYELCAYQTLKFTSPETLLYYAQNLDAHKQYDYLLKTYQDTAPESYQALGKFNETVTAHGLDLNKNILDAVGPEVAFSLEWPKESLLPDAAFFVELSHPDDFKPVTDLLVKNLEPLTESKTNKDGKPISPVGMIVDGQAGSYQLKTFKFTKSLPLSPTLANSANFCALFLTEQGARRALDKNNQLTLKDGPGFKTSGADLSGTSAFVFVDMSRLTDHLYETAKPYYSMALAFSPDLQAMLKDFKLPNSLGFIQPLGCWTMTSQVDDEAFTIHSKSGIGTPILPVLMASGAVGAITRPGSPLKGKHVAQTDTPAPATTDTALTTTTVTTTAPAPDTTISGGTLAISPEAVNTDQTTSIATTASTPVPTPAPTTQPSAEDIREHLEELRTIIDAWISEENVPKGTPVTWSNLEHYLVKDSPLEKSHGQDDFGAPYILGVVGEKPADLDVSTKNRFPDKDATYWAPLSEQ